MTPAETRLGELRFPAVTGRAGEIWPPFHPAAACHSRPCRYQSLDTQANSHDVHLKWEADRAVTMICCYAVYPFSIVKITFRKLGWIPPHLQPHRLRALQRRVRRINWAKLHEKRPREKDNSTPQHIKPPQLHFVEQHKNSSGDRAGKNTLFTLLILLFCSIVPSLGGLSSFRNNQATLLAWGRLTTRGRKDEPSVSWIYSVSYYIVPFKPSMAALLMEKKQDGKGD